MLCLPPVVLRRHRRHHSVREAPPARRLPRVAALGSRGQLCNGGLGPGAGLRRHHSPRWIGPLVAAEAVTAAPWAMTWQRRLQLRFSYAGGAGTSLQRYCDTPPGFGEIDA